MKKTFLLLSAVVIAIYLTACSSQTKTTPADQLLNDDIFKQATNDNNLARCKDILDSKLKSSCEQVINDRNITNDAVSTLDKGKCKKVSDERYRQNCETQIDTKMEAKNADTKRLSIEQSAVDKKDPSICDQIEDNNQKYSCRYNIIVNKAIQEKNPEICETIGKESVVEECKKSANLN